MNSSLVRDNRLRAAGFRLLSHLASNRRFWRLTGGFLPLDHEEADTLIDMLVDDGYIYAGTTGLWKSPEGEVMRTIEAVRQIHRRYAVLVAAHVHAVR